MKKRFAVCVVIPAVLIFLASCGSEKEDFKNKESPFTMSTENTSVTVSETTDVTEESSRSQHTTKKVSTSPKEETTEEETKSDEPTTDTTLATTTVADVVTTVEFVQTTVTSTTAQPTETSAIELTAPRMEEWGNQNVGELVAPNLEDCFIPEDPQEYEALELLPPSIDTWTWNTPQETLSDETNYDNIDNFQIPDPVDFEPVIENIPYSVQAAIEEQQRMYPHMKVAVGFFALDGSKGYVYNGDTRLFGACTIKAAYACFVLKEAQRRGINIDEYQIEYVPSTDKMGGSGNIADSSRRYYTVKELLYKLISISDNTAYRMLDKVFSVDDFKRTLKDIGGATEFKNRYFSYTSVYERYNEWRWIYEYEQTGTEYAQYLQSLLKCAQAYYLGIGSYTQHQHKSGWTENDDGYMYTACDAGIVSGKYILVILTRDDWAEAPNANPVRAIGRSVNDFVLNNNVF